MEFSHKQHMVELIYNDYTVKPNHVNELSRDKE